MAVRLRADDIAGEASAHSNRKSGDCFYFERVVCEVVEQEDRAASGGASNDKAGQLPLPEIACAVLCRGRARGEKKLACTQPHHCYCPSNEHRTTYRARSHRTSFSSLKFSSSS